VIAPKRKLYVNGGSTCGTYKGGVFKIVQNGYYEAANMKFLIFFTFNHLLINALCDSTPHNKIMTPAKTHAFK
jgi:hypothetical protein